MARSTKKIRRTPFLIMVIGFAVGFLFGRGLEWEVDEDEDQWS